MCLWWMQACLILLDILVAWHPEGLQILADRMGFVNDNMNKHQTMQITINIEHIKYTVYIFARFLKTK